MRRVVVPIVSALFLSGLAATAPAHAAVLCDVKGTLEDVHGTAVPGATLSFTSDTGAVTVKTRSTGAFTAAAACGTAEVNISWGKASLTSLPASARLRGRAKLVDGHSYAFRLPAAVTATLAVVDPDGKPVAGATVAQQNEDESYTANTATVLAGASAYSVFLDLANRRTDAAGKVSYLTFPNSAMKLTILPPANSGLRHVNVVLDASKSGAHTTTLPTITSGPSLSGVVHDAAGNGVPGLSVSLAGQSEFETYRTDADGRFTVYGDAGPTQLWLELNANGALFPEPVTPGVPTNLIMLKSLPVTVGSPTPVTITLPPVAHIRLHVLDADGQPQNLAYLNPPGNGPFTSDPAVLMPGTPAVQMYTYYDTQAWSGYGNAGAGVLKLNLFPIAHLSGMRVHWLDPDGDTLYATVPTFDATHDQDVTVTLPRPPTKYTVSGTITDADGTPVTGLRVSAGVSSYSDLDSTGYFSVRVAEGHGTLTLDRQTYWPGWVATPSLPTAFGFHIPVDVAGDRSVSLRLPRTSTITMHVVDPVDHQPVTAYLDKWEDDDFASTIPNLTVAGADGPATATVYVRQAQTQQPGVSQLHWWPQARMDDILVEGSHGTTTLKTRVVGLEVAGDKEFNVVLGTTTAPSTYSRPGAVTGLTAEPAAGPSPARAVVATAPTAAATVRWAAPKHTGGLPITGYRVTASPGGKTVRVGKSKRQAVLSGLTAGTAYTFKVQAINGVGTAKGSSAQLDTAAPTATLTAPHATSTHKKAVTFAWTGTDDASGIAGYDVRVRSGKTHKWVTVATATTKTSRSIDLRPGYTTCVSVRATDKVGRVGAWSAPRCVSRPAD